jgi:hypothetical protein
MSSEEMTTQTESMVLIPASITTVPNLYYSATGSVELSSPATEPTTTSFFSFSTSWNVRGDLEVDLNTSWNVGEGAYYWYRVESECGEVTCDEFGVERRDCNSMTIVNTVSARSVAELCDTLANPRTNAPLVARISSIRRYGRPMFRDQIQPNQCNTLDEVEFCHIPECLDYCVDPAPAAPFLASLEDEGFEEVAAEDLLPETSLISVCGCDRSSASMPLGHSLGRSKELSRFVRSGGLSLPASFNLIYREEDSTWSHTAHLRSSSSSWTMRISLGCQPNLWTFALSVFGEGRQTRLVFDAPSELICAAGRPAALVQCYFDSPIQSPSRGRSFQVVDPPRRPVPVAVDRAEVFVDGIFVPFTVYYDGLGIFKDSFWRSSPLEFDINPISRGRTRTVTLEGIA